MIDTLYSMLIGSLLIVAIAFVWVLIVALIVSSITIARKRLK